jgi:hypothetical protein
MSRSERLTKKQQKLKEEQDNAAKRNNRSRKDKFAAVRPLFNARQINNVIFSHLDNF